MGSVNRQPYITATVLNQAFLDECQDNLENRLELAADIQAPDATFIRVSDRNKFIVNSGVGTFYQARTKFPVIQRTLGEWLSTEVEFSSLTLEVSNVDEAYSGFMPAGGNYSAWTGKQVTVSLGISEQGSTYSGIFQGRVTSVSGFGRSMKSFTLTARDRFDALNINFPQNLFLLDDWPHIDDSAIGTAKPIIYGDWTVALGTSPAQVPGLVVNGSDLLMNSAKTLGVQIATGSSIWISGDRHKLQINDPVQLAGATPPAPFATGTTYYVVGVPTAFSFQLSDTLGGGALVSGGGGTSGLTVMGDTGKTSPDSDPTTCRNTQCFISDNVNAMLDLNRIYLKRGDIFYPIPQSELANVSGSNNYFEVMQVTGNQWVIDDTVDPPTQTQYIYADGDLFFVQLKGKDIGAYSSNLIWQARDILETICGLGPTDFDTTSWYFYRDKNSPPQSAIANIPSRIWVQEQTPVMQYVQSMMTQVRLEMFQARDLTLKLHSLHFEDWVASPSFQIKQWDISRDSLTPKTDERINFNRAQGSYNFSPADNAEAYSTAFYRNQAAIDQTALPPLPVIPVSKILVFPNLYTEADVINQVIEMLKIGSGTIETVEVELTWRAMLLDLGDFVTMNIKVGGIDYESVPMMVRSVGYDPDGLKIPVKLWSLQLLPYPGYTPGYAGTVGGYSATITQET